MSEYLIGQRVLLGHHEIGTVTAAPDGQYTPRGYLWVHSPRRGFASCYAEHNVQPLPGGQL